jgi:hypothetical protein
LIANFPGLELKHGRAGDRGRGRRSGQGGHTRVISCWDATVAAAIVAAVALGLQQVLVEGSLHAAGHIAQPVGHSCYMAAKQRLMAARSIVASQGCIAAGAANEDTIGSRIGSSSSCLVARHHGLVGSPSVG